MGRRNLLGGLGSRKASKEKLAEEDKKVKDDKRGKRQQKAGAKLSKSPSTPKLEKKKSTRDRAKQKSENNRSLRKIKKRDVVSDPFAILVASQL